MQRIILTIIVLLVVLGAVAGAYVYFGSHAATTDNTNVSGNGSIEQNAPQTPPDHSSTLASSRDAVLAAFIKAIAIYNQDTLTYGNTYIVNGYAIQLWQGKITGGEALLQYRQSKDQWYLVSANGGVWSLQGLIEFGVPTTTAKALYADISH